MVVLIVGLTIAVFLGVEAVLRFAQKLSSSSSRPSPVPSKGQFQTPFLPRGLFLHPGHTWAEILPSGRIRAGIDDFVRYTLGRPDKLILRTPGERVEQGDPFLTLERNGRRLVLPAPVSGVVERYNEELVAHPEGLGRTPYGENWACTLRPDSLGTEIASLKIAERASRWLEEEMRRLAEWLADRIPIQQGTALQDGGLPAPEVLDAMDEKAWREFQRCFLDRNDDAATNQRRATH